MKKLSFFLFVILVPLWVLAQDGTKPIVTSDVMKITTANQLAISPDGSKAVMVITKRIQKGEQYGYTRNLWLLDLVANTAPLQLTHGDRSDGSPVWSPDGKHLAFVRSHEGKSQIWILPMSGGEAYALTASKNGASRPRWAPDGRAILFSSSIPYHQIEGPTPWEYERPGRSRGDEPNWKALKEEEKKEIKATPDGNMEQIRAWLAKNTVSNNPRVLNRLQFQAEQGLQPEWRFTHVYLQSLKTGEKEQALTSGLQSYSNPEWSVDGKQILVTASASTQAPDYERQNELWIMNADGTQLRPLLAMSTHQVSNGIWSPDGKHILFSASPVDDRHATQNQLGIVQANGQNPALLTANYDRDVSSAQWSFDGKTIYFTSSTEGNMPLLSIPAKGGVVTTVVGGQGGVTDYSLLKDRLVYAYTEVRSPNEVFTMTLKDKKPRQLTQMNTDWVKEKRVLPYQEYWITRPDGMKVQYWVIEPALRKDGTKYPTVLEIHGGPTAMWGPSSFSMWHEFQLMASWGYGVVFCNPRGSGGYGDAFKKGNFQDWGTGPANDILAALEDASSKHAWIDTQQLFVTGGSYAGYMVAWLVSQDQRFKAANAQRGVYELTTFMGEGNAWRLVPTHFGGYPWEKEIKEILDANSPMTYVHQINTPLLIMHSDEDLRTGVIQSEMLYKSLKILEKPVEYVRYPGEGHELSRSGNPLRIMDRLIRIIEFFDRYTEHPATPPAAIQP
jgi:dipeptidyl aminopeptidase/acylaminoacyl peptidase